MNGENKRDLRIETVRKGLPFRVWDLALYGVILIAALIVLWAVFANRPRSESLVLDVFVDNRTVMTVPLSRDAEYEIRRGETTLLILCVRDGSATVRAAVCEDKLCEGMRIDGYGGQIVCLPSAVAIAVREEGMGSPVVPVE